MTIQKGMRPHFSIKTPAGFNYSINTSRRQLSNWNYFPDGVVSNYLTAKILCAIIQAREWNCICRSCARGLNCTLSPTESTS